MKKLIRKAVSVVMNATYDSSMRISKKTAHFTMSLGKGMKDMGHVMYVIGRAEVEQLEEIEADRQGNLDLLIDLYTALLTGDKEELSRIILMQLEKGMAKAQAKPPQWATDMNAN